MNNPNPFVPQGSLLELASKRRSRMKLGVLCVLVVGIAGLTAMLIQGCKREQANDQSENQPPPDTNAVAMDTNPPAMVASNVPPPPPPPPPVVAQPPPENPGSEYTVKAGDTLGKIAHKNGVSLSALKAANPGVEPTKLKVGQKLTIPAGGTAPAAGTSDSSAGGGETYVVKSGDSLTKIAKAHGVTVRALRAENNLTTDHIKVGEKLKIPSSAPAAAPAAAPAPMAAPAPAPATGAPPSGT